MSDNEVSSETEVDTSPVTETCQGTSANFPEIEMQPMKRSQSMPSLHADVPEFSHHSESDNECW